MVVIALWYVGGLLLAGFVPLPLAVLFGLSLAVVAVGLVQSALRPWVLGPLLVLAGWTNLTTRTTVVSPRDLRVVAGSEPCLVTVRGVLRDTPDTRVYQHGSEKSWRSLAKVAVTRIRRQGTDDSAASGEIMASIPGTVGPAFFAGQEVEITGVLARPAGPLAAGLFDYRTYLRRQGIHYQLKSDSTNDWSVVSTRRATPLSDRFIAWAQRILALGLPDEDLNRDLLWAMTLGWKTGISGEVYEPFMQSGTLHVFAISGLHIALIAGILVSLLRVAQIPRPVCAWIILPLIWFYTAATGWQPSAIRSTVMMTIVIGGWALQRPGNLLNSLASAGFVILLWDPQQLFGASFQLSFFVVLSIALLMPLLEPWRDRLLAHDPLLPDELVPVWRRRLIPPLRGLLTAVGVSLAAWLGSLPLIAYYFHILSPVTLAANVVIVPLSSIALACNLGSLTLGWFAPWLAEWLNHSAWLAMACMVRLSQWAALMPKGFFYVPGPMAFDFFAYYFLLLGTLSGWILKPGRRYWMLAVVLVAGAVFAARWQASNARTEITVLPLNGGFATCTDSPGQSRDALVDTGNTNAVTHILRPFLQAKGVNRIPRLILTHGDIDHVGGAQLLDAALPANEVCASPVRFRSGVYRKALDHFDQAPARLRKLSLGESAGAWTVLHPDAAERPSLADDGAMVLKTTLGQYRVLLISDLSRQGQEVLLRRGADLQADVVIAGVPSRGEPLCEDLVTAIQPRLILLADSEFPAPERANPATVERLSRSAPVICTRNTGAVTITLSKGRCAVRAINGWQLDL